MGVWKYSIMPPTFVWVRIEINTRCVILSLLLIEETQPLVNRAVVASECLRSERYDQLNHSNYA